MHDELGIAVILTDAARDQAVVAAVQTCEQLWATVAASVAAATSTTVAAAAATVAAAESLGVNPDLGLMR